VNHTCIKEESWWEYDAQGIELCKVCEECKEEKLARYRPCILEGYDQADVDEPIEPEWRTAPRVRLSFDERKLGKRLGLSAAQAREWLAVLGKSVQAQAARTGEDELELLLDRLPSSCRRAERAEVHWRLSRSNHGNGKPMAAALAEAVVEEMNKEYGDGTHWVVRVYDA
jgi:hypothetical protein